MTSIRDSTQATTPPDARRGGKLVRATTAEDAGSLPTVAASRSSTTSAVVRASIVSKACRRPRRATTFLTMASGMPLGWCVREDHVVRASMFWVLGSCSVLGSFSEFGSSFGSGFVVRF